MFMAVGYTVIEVADFVRRRELFEGDGLTVDFFLFRAVYFLVAFWFLARMRGLIPRGQRARP